MSGYRFAFALPARLIGAGLALTVTFAGLTALAPTVGAIDSALTARAYVVQSELCDLTYDVPSSSQEFASAFTSLSNGLPESVTIDTDDASPIVSIWTDGPGGSSGFPTTMVAYGDTSPLSSPVAPPLVPADLGYAYPAQFTWRTVELDPTHTTPLRAGATYWLSARTSASSRVGIGGCAEPPGAPPMLMRLDGGPWDETTGLPLVIAGSIQLETTPQRVDARAGTPITATATFTTEWFSTTYAISPPLPDGLSFDTGTGVASGTPMREQPTASHTVTATGALTPDGPTTTAAASVIDLTVSAAVPPADPTVDPPSNGTASPPQKPAPDPESLASRTPAEMEDERAAKNEPAIEPIPLADPPLAGSGGLHVSGLPADLVVTPDSATSTVGMRGGGLTMALISTTVSGARLPLSEDRTMLLSQEGDMAVLGAGFRSHSWITLYAFSDPTFLGNLRVSATGTVSGSVTLPAAIDVGEHTLQAVGVDAAGEAVSLTLGVSVVSPPIAAAYTTVYLGSVVAPRVGGSLASGAPMAIRVIVRDGARGGKRVSDHVGAELSAACAVTATVRSGTVTGQRSCLRYRAAQDLFVGSWRRGTRVASPIELSVKLASTGRVVEISRPVRVSR